MNKKNIELLMNIDGLTLYALYGNACLGLKHPLNRGKTRIISINAIKKIGAYLVENGVITQAMTIEHEKGL